MPSRTPPDDPGRFTIRVRPRIPATAREAGDLPFEYPARHLRRQVGGGEAGTAGGDRHVIAVAHRVSQHLLNRIAIGDDQRTVDEVTPRLPQQLHEHRP